MYIEYSRVNIPILLFLLFELQTYSSMRKRINDSQTEMTSAYKTNLSKQTTKRKRSITIHQEYLLL